jgi:hypothetical protein
MRYRLIEYRGGFCLEIGEDIDQAILRGTVIMFCTSSQMGVLDRCSVHNMRMRKHADTRIVTAEEQQ